MAHGNSSSKKKGPTFTRQQMAALWGVGVDHFDKRHRRFVAPEHITTGPKRRPLFTPEAIVDIANALVAEEREKARQAAAVAQPASGDDASARRLRQLQTQLAEMELEQKLGQLVHRDDLAAGFQRFAAVVRRGMQQLGKLHGADAQAIAEQAIDRAVRAVEEDLTAKP